MGREHFRHFLLSVILSAVAQGRAVQPQRSSVNDLEIRLVDGPSEREGRLEVRRNGTDWGTVCGGVFDYEDAAVVCRQLNMGITGSPVHDFPYGGGSGTIHLGDLNCVGTEHNLGSCSHSEWGIHYCDPFDAAGVMCYDLEIRLVNGSSEREGRLEVRRTGSDWGTVCDQDFDYNAAAVVCRQLNMSITGSPVDNARYGTGSGTMHLDEMYCVGTEMNLGSCSHRGWGIHDCDPSDAVGVMCYDFEIRLVNGSSEREGRLEVRRTGSDWGTVCDDWFDNRAAAVVCRQLNMNATGIAIPRAHYGTGSGTMHLSRVLCWGQESNLGSCRHQGWRIHSCSPQQAVGVQCLDLQIRLVNGSSEREGRLEVRQIGGDWGIVCDDGFDNNGAAVVCRQLNMSATGNAIPRAHYGTGSGTIHLAWVQCTGRELNLGSCSHPGWRIHSCNRRQAVGVQCFGTR